ncbi:MAG: hypothetical protein IPM16_23210 [Chloroflexi bacterium]|nr:hypothetical protein [Chloroflexota bacterium]
MYRTLIVIAGLLMLAAGLALAQEPAPTETPNLSFSCDPDALQTYAAARIISAQVALAESTDPEGINAALGQMYLIGEEFKARALACGYIPENIGQLPIGEDTSTERVLEVMDTLTGDPLRGQLLYLGQERSSQNATLGCSGCHETGDVAPITEGTWTRWDEERRLLPEYAEQEFAYYAVESILHPNVYVVPPYGENLMPAIYTLALGYQDLLDLILFLESQDQLP